MPLNDNDLKNLFQQIPNEGESLPDINEVPNNWNFILIEGNTETLYISRNGVWRIIGVLT